MNSITTLDHLITTLKAQTVDQYRSLGKLLDIPAAEFTPYAHWEDGEYTRNCIERTDDFELLLLCWNPGDGTPVHCHGQQRCWVYQVSGSLKEDIYTLNANKNLVLQRSQNLDSGALTYMDDSMGYHTLANASDAMAMSLHLYANPIDECTYYDDETGTFTPKELTYTSFKGELLPTQDIETNAERLRRLSKSAII